MKDHAPKPYNGEPNEGRRGFLKGLLAVGAGAFVGIKGNKYIEQEKQLNQLHDLFKGNEESFHYANKAIHQLLNEMELENITRVKISGTGHPNERITFLRDFLTKHLYTQSGKKYHGLKDTILKEGVYTVDGLRALLEASQHFSLSDPRQEEKKKEGSI